MVYMVTRAADFSRPRQEASMARISHVGETQLPAALRPLYRRFATDYGGYLHMAGALAHRPEAVEHIIGLLLKLAENPINQRRHLEIGMATASAANQCHYCVAHHRPHMEALGLAAETIERILEPDCPVLDPLDRLVRDYALEVSLRAHAVSDETVAQLRRHFSEAQLVDLTLRITLCAFFNRFNQVFDLQLEDGFAASHAKAAE